MVRIFAFWTDQLNMAKIGIKTLIESSIGFSALGETHNPLKQFCILVETIISHGVKQGSSIREKFATRKGLWGMLEAFETMSPECTTVNEAVRANALLKTNIGRVRAWIRIAMEQKAFPNIVRDLVSSEALLFEWYVFDRKTAPHSPTVSLIDIDSSARILPPVNPPHSHTHTHHHHHHHYDPRPALARPTSRAGLAFS